MKRLLNTLYVTTEGAALRKDGENAVVLVDGEERGRVPLHMLASIVAFGPVVVTPSLIGAVARAGITIVLLDRIGRFEARVEGPVSGNVLLRRAQYAASDAPFALVRDILMGKLANQRTCLVRALRERRPDGEARAAIRAATDSLARLLRLLDRNPPDDVDAMRGMEGEAAALYFGVFDHLVARDEPELIFGQRSRRPPRNRVNALLSFLYTLLTHDCRSACEAVGLDPAVGFLHRDRPGRPSLALDLMEELRPVLVDRMVTTLLNRRQIGVGDFVVEDGGAVALTEEGRRTVLTAWQERKKKERVHPFLGESVPFGLVPYVQAQMLSRHLRGDLDAYPPWLWR